MVDLALNINVDVVENLEGFVTDFKLQLIHFDLASFRYEFRKKQWVFTDLRYPLRKNQTAKIIEDSQLNYLTSMFLNNNISCLDNFFIQQINMNILCDLNMYRCGLGSTKGVRAKALAAMLRKNMPYVQQFSFFHKDENEPFLVKEYSGDIM